MKTIIALVDFSDLALKVLKQAHSFAMAFGSKVVLVHVVPPEPVVLGFGPAAATITRKASPDEVAKDAEQLKELTDSLKNAGVDVHADQLQVSSVDEVLAESRRLQADLIIVGSHNHGPLYNLIIGSVTQNVLKDAPCPVLVVPSA
jgi:nucleotide-binding universal stress UspA family protein